MKLAELLLEGSKYPFLREPLPTEPQSVKFEAYHATSLDHWPTIKSKGLVPGKSKPSGQTWAGRWSGKGIYYHLQFPQHEIDNSFNPDDGEVFNLVIELQVHIYSGYVVPDEDVTTELDDTKNVIKDKNAVAVGYPMPPSSFKKIHLADTPEAREWAKKNVKRWPVEFHKVDYRA